MDLAGQLLNNEKQICQVLDAAQRKHIDQPRPERQEKLSKQRIDELTARYQAGESTRQLAEDYSAHRHTITRALRNAGVELRHKRRRLTDAQVSEAAELYRSGQTLTQLAARFGVGQETIRRELTKADVTLRPRGGSASGVTPRLRGAQTRL